MLETKITGNGDTGTVVLEGQLTIQYIDRIKDAIMEAFSQYKTIDVDITGMSNIDFTCLQLFCSAHKTAVKQDKSLLINPPPGEAFHEILENAGLSQDIVGSSAGAAKPIGVRGFKIKGE